MSRQAIGGIAARFGVTVEKYEGRLWVPLGQAEIVCASYAGRLPDSPQARPEMPPPPPGLTDWVQISTLAQQVGLSRSMGRELVERFHAKPVAAWGSLWIPSPEAERIRSQYQSWKSDRETGLSTSDVALMLNRSRSTVHGQRRNGKLKAVWGGRGWIYDRESVRQYLPLRRNTGKEGKE